MYMCTHAHIYMNVFIYFLTYMYIHTYKADATKVSCKVFDACPVTE